MATHSSILARKISWTEWLGGCSLWGSKESNTTEYVCMICLSLAFFLFIMLCIHRLHETKKLCFISVLGKVLLVIKNPPVNARDTKDEVSIPGSRRSPGSVFLPKKSHRQMAYQATIHGVSKSWIQLSN